MTADVAVCLLHPVLRYSLTVDGVDTEATPPPVEWVPESCTLPTAEQPLRVAEFDDLFAAGLWRLERLNPTALRLYLDPEMRGTAVDLTDRETGCCSFFTFDVTSVGELVALDAGVPPGHVDVLDALAARAANAAGLSDE